MRMLAIFVLGVVCGVQYRDATTSTAWPDSMVVKGGIWSCDRRRDAAAFLDANDDGMPDYVTVGRVSLCGAACDGVSMAAIPSNERQAFDAPVQCDVTPPLGPYTWRSSIGTVRMVQRTGLVVVTPAFGPVTDPRVLRNLGNLSFVASPVPSSSFAPVSANAFAVGDLDNDGLDEVVLSFLSVVVVLRNLANDSFVDRAAQFFPGEAPIDSRGLVFGRLFSDSLGAVDLFDVAEISSQLRGMFRGWRFAANATFAAPVTFAPRTMGGPEGTFVKVGDFNGDGVADFIYRSVNKLLYYVNNGSGGMVDRSDDLPIPPSQRGSYPSAAMLDLDYDGTDDVVLASDSKSQQSVVLWGSVSGNFSTSFVATYLGGTTVTAARLSPELAAIVWLQRSNALDKSATPLYITRFTRTRAQSHLAVSDWPLPTSFFFAAVAAGDVNNDGCQDIAVAGETFGVDAMSEVLISNCDGTFRPLSFQLPDVDHTTVQVASFFTPGFSDVFIGGLQGSVEVVKLARNDGSGALSYDLSALPPGLEASQGQSSARDVNMDGLLDLTVFQCGSNCKLYVMLNSGTNLSTVAIERTFVWQAQWPRLVLVSDVRGVPQIFFSVTVVINGNGMWVENFGNGSFAAAIVQPEFDYLELLTDGDVDGDGIGDIGVGFDNGGFKAMCLFGTDNGTFVRHIVRHFSSYVSGIALLNGGRDMLIVTGDSAMPTALMLGQTNRSFIDASAALPSLPAYISAPMAFGDFNGDGIDDFFIAGTAINCGFSYVLSDNATSTTMQTSSLGEVEMSSNDEDDDATLAIVLGVLVGSGGAVGGGLFIAAVAICCTILLCLCLCALLAVFMLAVLGVGVVLAAGVGVLGSAAGAVSVARMAKGPMEGPEFSSTDDEETAAIALLQRSDVRSIRFDELEIGVLLGTGSCGEVYRGTWNGVEVAIKVSGNVSCRDVVGAFEREALAMAKVAHHPHVVGLVGIVSEPSHLALVMRFCNGGALDAALRAGLLDADMKRTVLAEAAAGLAFIHSQGLVHRDVAARNVMLDSDGAKLGDLGLARVEGHADSDGASVGPVRWMAPEALADHSFSPATDAWAFGVLMWEVWTDAALPYGDINGVADVATAVVRHGRLLATPPHMPSDHERVFRALLNRDARCRCLMSEAASLLSGQRNLDTTLFQRWTNQDEYVDADFLSTQD